VIGFQRVDSFDEAATQEFYARVEVNLVMLLSDRPTGNSHLVNTIRKLAFFYPRDFKSNCGSLHFGRDDNPFCVVGALPPIPNCTADLKPPILK
jgi:hypothetical protein